MIVDAIEGHSCSRTKPEYQSKKQQIVALAAKSCKNHPCVLESDHASTGPACCSTVQQQPKYMPMQQGFLMTIVR